MTEEARKLYDDGVQAVSESRWEAAHALFLAARALHPHYTIVGNLGDCELHLGRYREAAENLALYVRELKKDTTSTAEERARAEAAYANARAKVGTLVVRTNVDGARVFVDGAFQGVTPLPDPLFVEPGAHTISVEHEDYETKKTTVQLGAGGQIENPVELRQRSAGAPPPKRLDTTIAPLARGAEEHARDPRAALLIGGAATAGAAAVAGVVFTVLSNGKATDADTLATELTRDGGKSACWSRTTPRCSTLHDLNEQSDAFHNLAVAGFVGAGVVGAATLVYGLWPRASTETRVTPVVGASAGGVVLSGRF